MQSASSNLSLHEDGRNTMRLTIVALVALFASQSAALGQDAGLVEPKGGAWKTWVIGSGSAYRVPPPPDLAMTTKELDELVQIAANRDRAAIDRVVYWNTGSPSYRWSEIAVAEYLKAGLSWPVASRGL